MNFTREELLSALNRQTILPSLFTCFLLICFARGYICVGGVFQGVYLNRMKRCIADCLDVQADTKQAKIVREITTDLYQDGMLAFMKQGRAHELLPAGPIEIIQGGAITKKVLNNALDLSVTQAHMAGLLGSLEDAGAPVTRRPNWQHRVAQACAVELSGKISVL